MAQPAPAADAPFVLVHSGIIYPSERDPVELFAALLPDARPALAAPEERLDGELEGSFAGTLRHVVLTDVEGLYADWPDRSSLLHEIRAGELEKLLLLPTAFGGAEVPENTLYVPPWVCSTKAGFEDNVLRPMVGQGMRVHYSGIPEYQDGSCIPIAITLVLAPDRGRQVSYTIRIWGEALGRDGGS